MNIFFPLRLLLAAVIIFAVCTVNVNGQRNLKLDRPGSTTQPQYDAQGRVIPNSRTQKGQDSLKHRDNTEDSITIHYRFFDSTTVRNIDSSINNFTTRYPVPAQYVTLGNFGSAAHSLLFNPNLKPGFDPGFHAFDIYRFNFQETKFYQTTRPYTELGYLLGSKAEQMIDIVHTQNIRPNFNMALQYRLINSPGNLQNQNTSHNSYRINGNYQSRNKRYTAYGIFLANKLLASENGGIINDSLLNDYRFTNRYLIPTRLSGDSAPIRNPFNTRVTTGNVYRESNFLLRQQYDFGQSDSIVVNDSTVIRLFYPRFRLQNTFILSNQQYEYRDYFTGDSKVNDYKTFFGKTVTNDSLLYHDKWKNIRNEFSLISFPEKNNLNQFLKAGIAYEAIKGTFDSTLKDTPVVNHYHNIFLTGEYRNRTRNQKWDIESSGGFYLNGYNAGDYAFRVNLKRLITKKVGYLEAGFQNINRTPSLIFGRQTAFPVKFSGSLNKENITRISGSITNDAKGTALTGEYYLISNYTYFDSFFSARQEATLFNVLHVAAKKKLKLSKVLNLYTEVHLQKTAGNPPINIPLVFTSNRLSFEGVYYKNMIYAIGIEVRYHTPYKADNYSPFVGQFFYQNNYTISNRPEVNAFFDFRIKSFKAFIRAENLNTIGTNTGSFGLNQNNLTAQHYPQQGFWFRTGIWWTFVN
jgi:hypothetical protein